MNGPLSGFTSEELQSEIDRRRDAVPEPMALIAGEAILSACKAYLDVLFYGQSPTIDDKIKVFVITMESVYGNKIWEWIDRRAKKT